MSFFTLALLVFCSVFYVAAIAYRLIYDNENVDIFEVLAAYACVVFVACVWIF